MSSILTFPSESAPAFPAISLTLPEGWSPISATGAVCAAGKAVEPGAFRPNVVVAVSRFAGAYALDTAIEAVAAKVHEIAGVEELGSDRIDVLGQEGFRIEFSYPDDRIGTLMQAVRIAVVENGPVSDLVQITATATGSEASELWGEIRELQSSAQLESSAELR
jgi:hypothetical protein